MTAKNIDSEFRRIARVTHPDKGQRNAEAYEALSSIRTKFDGLVRELAAETAGHRQAAARELVAKLRTQLAQLEGEMQDTKRSLAEATHQWRHWCGRAQSAERGLQSTQAQASSAVWWHNRCESAEHAARKAEARAAELEGLLHVAAEDVRRAENRERSAAEGRAAAQADAEYWAQCASEAQKDTQRWTQSASEAREAAEYWKERADALLPLAGKDGGRRRAAQTESRGRSRRPWPAKSPRREPCPAQRGPRLTPAPSHPGSGDGPRSRKPASARSRSPRHRRSPRGRN